MIAKRMTRFVAWAGALMMGMSAVRAAEVPGGVTAPKRPLVQIAILLDCSGSMDGLIDQAKTQLWRIVNEFATAKRHGQSPILQVALYEYGKDEIPAKDHYLRQVLPLSTDLDKLSEELFKLKTNGGEEYCGWVIRKAVEDLKWSEDKHDLKTIFICGNEPFTQGDYDYKLACKTAIERGITVNTIFAGNHSEGINTKWKDGADLADGKYINIDQDQKIAAVDAPQDKALAELGDKLNKTYIAVGAAGKEGKDRQIAQDAKAAGVNNQVAAQRNLSKANAQYHCDWDLCDAYKEKKIKIEDVKEEDLPDELKKLKKEDRRAYVENKIKERSEIQEQIKKLAAEREKHVAAELKKLAKAGADTLDAAMIRIVREQATKKDYKFE